jgi:Tol biopolymer transport system component
MGGKIRLSEDKDLREKQSARRFIVMALRFISIAQIRTFLILGLFILGFACAKPKQTVLAKPPQPTEVPSGSSQAESAAGTEAPSPQIVFKGTTLKIGWPAPAPDGSALIFSGHDGQRWSLYRLKIGTHKPEPLTAGLKRHATRPVYSHDGRKIAFRLSEHGNGTAGAVWVMDLATKTTRSFHAETEEVWDAYPEWFADGRRILVTRKRTETQSHDLVVLGDDNLVEVITHTPHYDGKPTLSPDGRRAVFPSNRGKVISLWQVDIAAGESSATQLTQQEARAPDWSPDGRWIAFQSNRGGAYDIYLVNIADGRECQVTHGMDATHPEWSADGRWLYFTAGGLKGTFQRIDIAAWLKATDTKRRHCKT